MTLAVDLFSGPRGWDVHADELGIESIGVEWDTDACATSRAAGLHVIQRDVASLRPEVFRDVYGQPEGVIASPPCPLYSTAGKGHGRAVELQRDLHEGMKAAAAGASREDLARRRAEVRRVLAAYLMESAPAANFKATRRGRRARAAEATAVRRADRSRQARKFATEACLVWEPARWIAALRPSWAALEQVPPVLPLWKTLAHALEAQGYHCWVGVLSSERYGVPQTRKRAILLASLHGTPHPPEPTHQEYRPGEPAREAEATLFGPGLQPWVSMAEALGWGIGRFGFPRRDDTGTSNDGYRERDWRRTDEPAGVVTEKARSFVYESDPDDIEVKVNRGAGMVDRHGDRPGRRGSEPAPTIRSGEGGGCGPNLDVKLVNGTHEHRAERQADEPAPTLHFGGRLNTVSFIANDQPNATRRSAQEPAPTIKGGHDTADRRWVVDTGNTRGGTRESGRARREDEPAPVVTTRADQLERRRDPDRTVLDRNQRAGSGEIVGPRPATEPAPTIPADGMAKGNLKWRDKDEPPERAVPPTHLDRRQTGGDGAPVPNRPTDTPAPALTAQGIMKGRDVWSWDEAPQSAQWAQDRPATTVAGDPRVFPPGHKVNADDIAAGRGGQQRSGAGWTDGPPEAADEAKRGATAVRVTVQEAAILQSFPEDWPWRGTRTAQFQMIGNAVPPLFARKVLEAVIAPTRRVTGHC